jgi:hypothetical protein
MNELVAALTGRSVLKPKKSFVASSISKNVVSRATTRRTNR